MKTVRRTAVVLAAAIVILTLSLTVSAGNEPLFGDVLPSQWFYSDVRELTRAGIIAGYPDGSFRPYGNITCAEFLKLTVAAADISVRSGEYSHWAEPYIEAALNAGIVLAQDLTDGSFDADKPVTRAYMAALLVRALGIQFADIDNPFSDEADEYVLAATNEYLLFGYGDGDVYTFKGKANATRAEAAAVISRMLAYREDADSYKRQTVMGLDIIVNVSQCLDFLYYCHRDIAETVTFRSLLDIDELRECYDIMYQLHPEYVYIDNFGVEYYQPLENITEYIFTFDYGEGRDSLIEMRDKAERAAREAVSECIAADMSDEEKIKAIHDYLIASCAYDYDNYLAETIPESCYRAYGALVDGVAVCQGYSAAFNLMAGYAGVKSIAVVGTLPDGVIDNHMFNAVYLNGEILFIDVSADDPVPDREGGITYDNYLLNAEEFAALGYSWDSSVIEVKYFY